MKLWPFCALALCLVVALSGTLQAAPPASKKVIVYFKDVINPFNDESNRASILKAMEENLALSRQAVADVLEVPGAPVDNLRFIRIINGASMTADADFVKKFADHEAVKRILDDAPVYPPQLPPSTDKGAPDGEYAEGLPQVKAPEVWQLFGVTGAGVVVGHIDSGADGTHPDLEGRIVAYKDWVDVGNTVPKDTHGHGTHTAGTICGGGTSGVKIGVAPGASLVVARAIGYGSATSALLESMDWMCDPDGDVSTDDAPRLVSCSWHSGYGSQTPFYEALTAWVNLEIFPNFSAGNSGPNPSTITHPKEHPGVFCSAALKFNDQVASFSSRGPATYLGEQVAKPEAAAPGVDVYSSKAGGGYTRKSGTSMAAPHTAGVIALLLQACPSLTIADLREVLFQSTDELGDEGYDYTFGHGRVNALKAIELVAEGGAVQGVFRDGSTQAPLAGSVTVVEREMTIAADPQTGEFRFFLPAGDFTLIGRCFSYVDQTVAVTVAADQTVEQNFDLVQAPLVKVEGTVKSGETGEALAAQVSVLDTPLAPVETDAATGHFEVEVPAGSYSFRAFAFGHRAAVQGPIEVAGPLVLDFELEGLPPIVLVDDDMGESYQEYYEAGLAEAGLEYDIISTATGSVALEDILGYDMVFWYTGKATSKTLTDSDQAVLRAYLEAGGSLLLSGQDVGYELKKKPFYVEVLKAHYIKDTASSKEVEGQGLSFAIEGTGGANNQKYPDVIEPAEGSDSQLIYHYTSDEGAGLQLTYEAGRVVYLGFGIEAIPTAAARGQVITKAGEFLLPDEKRLVQRLVLLPRHLREQFMNYVLLPRLGHEGLSRAAKRAGVRPLLRALRALR